MQQPWFQHDPDDDPDKPLLPHLVCPTCGCPNINMIGHSYATKESSPDLLPHQQISIHLAGACGHTFMIFLADFGDETLLDIVSAPSKLRPRRYRRLSVDRRWK